MSAVWARGAYDRSRPFLEMTVAKGHVLDRQNLIKNLTTKTDP